MNIAALQKIVDDNKIRIENDIIKLNPEIISIDNPFCILLQIN